MKHVVANDGPVERASTWCLRFAEGRLPEVEDAQLRAWLAESAYNAAAFEAVASVWRAFEDFPASRDLIALRHAARVHFGRTQNSRWRLIALQRRWLMSAVACVGLIASTGALLWLHLSPDCYRTGLGERQVVAMGDGSQLMLDAESRVDVRYRRDRRELWLRRGRATFQVARDPLRPFIVAAADKLVVATGTEFSVELVSHEVRVVLYQGGVDVLSKNSDVVRPMPFGGSDHAKQRPLAKMEPGNELVAGIDDASIWSHAIDPTRTRAWESGQLAFNDEPLATAIERVNRHANPQIVVGDTTIALLRISGTFAAGDNAAFVKGITGVFPVRAVASGDSVVLVPAP